MNGFVARALGLAMACGALGLVAGPAHAQSPAAPSKPDATLLDRVVVRWHAPETGGAARPQFVFERELAFEARLESLSETDPEPGAYHERHVRAALERHIAETLLASLPITPAPARTVVEIRARQARDILDQRVHGHGRLVEAALAEGMGPSDLAALFERQARAGIYIDKMIAPMLSPSEIELRDLWRTGTTPFKAQPFDAIQEPLSRWYVGQRLQQALDTYFQNARARITVNTARLAPR